MNLTTKGRYAVMAMTDLALHGTGHPVALADIAARQGIALSYLEQIFMKLRKNGLVRSVRGPGGGYVLVRDAADMPVAEIVLAVDESIRMTRCGGGQEQSGCLAERGKCLTHHLWAGLGDTIFGYLQSVSLADVCEKRLPRHREMVAMPAVTSEREGLHG